MSIPTDKDDVRTFVEKTAYFPALMRAIDSVSPNRLVYDPVSLMLVPSEMFDMFYRKCPTAELQKTFIDFHAFRARAISEVLMTPHVLPQTVILGAGLDTFAWRECQLKDIYEIDQSEIFINKIKQSIKGFNPLLPTVWIMEGLLYYCTVETTKRIFQIIDRLSAEQSRIFFDHWPSNYMQTDTEIITLMRSFVDNPIEHFQWFINKGWSMTKMIDFSEDGEHYGRQHQIFYLKGIPLGLYFISASKITL